ncbi:MAG: O-acetylhomoserine aminocarboxypropyltransferase [Clostridiales bacterium GWF2_38_85]|nr:MAG: O-acetylhomoserine aminocarboxypropyltransferase [Clostridiales bacterium GWF2_38_85]HBL85469.1 bifunctional O-acetylhomoserine aminocarboxypropyltransferase/cysteine synthase [Clostridiales bacterium]
MRIETKCLHEGYHAENGQALGLPIYQSTTFRYSSPDEIAKLFDLGPGHMYSRISNPTVECVENKIAALEGGVAALCVSSGQSASFLAITNILSAGDHFIASSKLYGGTVNLFAVTLKRFGIECTFVEPDLEIDELQKVIKPNTKAVFAEVIANPVISVLDIEKFAKFAHSNGVPLIIDNTFPTPILCRPIEFGADIVIHSTTKYMEGHAIQIGGVVVDSGKFDWKDYPLLTTPDESYHGLIYAEYFGKAAYVAKMRVQLVRDIGNCQSAMGAFFLDLGLQTLAVRIEKHSKNADIVAKALEKNDKIEFVNYPTLASSPYKALAEKYLPNGCSGVLSFSIKGSRERAIKFMEGLQLANNVVHVADVRTCVLHPASSTHRQLTDEQLVGCGITPGMIRLSVGIENVDDILEDILVSLNKI